MNSRKCEIENCTFFCSEFLFNNFSIPLFLLSTLAENFCYFVYNLEKNELRNLYAISFLSYSVLDWPFDGFFFTFFWKLSKVCNIENWNWKFFETSKSFSFTQMSAYLLTVKRILFCKSAPPTSKFFSEIETRYLEMKLSCSLQDWKKVFHFLSWWSLYFYISKRTQL